jgi:hypothetical protein
MFLDKDSQHCIDVCLQSDNLDLKTLIKIIGSFYFGSQETNVYLHNEGSEAEENHFFLLIASMIKIFGLHFGCPLKQKTKNKKTKCGQLSDFHVLAFS